MATSPFYRDLLGTAFEFRQVIFYIFRVLSVLFNAFHDYSLAKKVLAMRARLKSLFAWLKLFLRRLKTLCARI